MTEPQAWRRTSPLAAVFFLFRLVKVLAKNAWQALAPLFALLVAYQGDLVSKLTIAGVALAVGSVVYSLAQYWFFRYRITAEAVLIREGVFNKKQLDIKFRRIQGINTEQGPIFRPFGLVTVRFDTAGSKGDEGALPAVSESLAVSLQRQVTETGVAPSAPAATAADGNAAPEVLLRLGWRDMLRIGLSDRRALVVLAVLGPLFEQLGDAGEALIESYVFRAAAWFGGIDVRTGAIIVATLVVGTLLLLATASTVAAFLRYHDFALTAPGARLHTVGGLLTRHTSSMDVSKIQVLRLQQGMLLRLFGRYRAVFRQATSGGRQAEGKSLVVPVVTPAFLPEIRGLAFGRELAGVELDPHSGRFARVSAWYLRPRLLLIGPPPVAVLMLATWPQLGPGSLWFLAWLPLAGLIAFWQWRRQGVQLHRDGLVHRSGFIGFRLDTFELRKVQRATVAQSPLQRRKRLASLKLHLASGSVTVPYIDHALACRLRDYVLYRVETSRRSWH